MTFGKSAFRYLSSVTIARKLPADVQMLLPFEDNSVKQIAKSFFSKFYNDNQKRRLILGINPGRFGAGVTGIAFTDPIRLKNILGIKNNLTQKAELSSQFIYQMIESYGGVLKFYSDFFISAVCPIGFIKDGKNLNYYDDRTLQKNLTEFIIKSLRAQIEFGCSTDIVYCLGDGKNYKFLESLNRDENFFSRIIPLPHPRYIMQYKRKSIDRYVTLYLEAFSTI